VTTIPEVPNPELLIDVLKGWGLTKEPEAVEEPLAAVIPFRDPRPTIILTRVALGEDRAEVWDALRFLYSHQSPDELADEAFAMYLDHWANDPDVAALLATRRTARRHRP
jgi:hypothetical protein